ncbi:hypothetical protein [Legionella maioricensis]|uniref:Uncharacterized protein n=1 Tax=Legionella maioricensis TaxID=2896528 RepID=A0A9X2D1J4_9GAMM|nr:hypothetical protein [Legionella maioricensis]MCL9684804.1 hypothetical protein [Legionella maioricensis]MCL9687794.1 hypothetical protein [Legionella maioricensis]
MVAPLTTREAQAQAIYMSELAKIALAEAARKGDTLSFDPQGRVLIDITPSVEQINAIMAKIKEKIELPDEIKTLDQAVGKKVTPTTTVSLDINTTPELKRIFDTKLKNALVKIEAGNPRSPQNATAIMEQLGTKPKSSLIALQQEYHFHLALVNRVYEKIAPNLPKAKMEAAHQAAMAEVNQLVMDAYAKALKGAMKNGTLDMAKLNKSLDKARKEILPEAHSIMMKQIVRHTGVILTQEQLKGVTNPDGAKETIKHVAEGTTATPNDVLHLDSELGLATLIAGSENTAHDRLEGKQFAHRQLITHSLKADGSIEANKNPRIQIRTPSPVLKKGLADDNAYINDVATKLVAVKEEYHLTQHLSGDGRKPKAFVYNSYTAINDTLGDINGNLQTQSADHILRGAHRYNVRQLRDNGADPVFCFVQNISVNGFGDTLGYGTGNPLREESTLMTEMALLHTLYDTSTGEEQEKIAKVFDKYKEYLRNPQRPSYFSNSPAGQQAKTMIAELKAEWKNKETPEVASVQDKVINGLKNLMAHNLHFDHEYSKLFQALSVYSEEASIGGCKSGNERAQAINGRIAILDSLSAGKDSPEMREIIEALSALATGGDTVLQSAQALKNAVDAEYNRIGLQSAASIVSLVDQGASAKVEAKNGSVWWWTSRNYAEEQNSAMDNLHQSKAGSMQAHKSLTTMMAEAWDFLPINWWERLKSGPLGTVGGVIAIIIAPIAVVVLSYHAFDNAARTSKTLEIIAMRNESNPDRPKTMNGSYGVMSKLSEGKEHAPRARVAQDEDAHALSQERSAPPGLGIATSLQTTGPGGLFATKVNADTKTQTVNEEVGSDHTPL